MPNSLTRILTGIIGIPLIIFLIVSGGYYFFAFALIVNILCLWEYNSLFIHKGYKPYRITTVVLSVVAMASFLLNTDGFIYASLLAVLVLAVFTVLGKEQNPVSLFVSIGGLIYITIPLMLMLQMINLYPFNPVLFMIVLVWVCDTGAYFTGLKFGKRKLSPISPNKTWEGSIGGFVFVMIAAFIYGSVFPQEIKTVDVIFFGLIVGTLGQIGDLFESMLKRFTGVKDSSGIIPGHGGFLDRFDSFLFVSIPVYLYLVFIRPCLF